MIASTKQLLCLLKLWVVRAISSICLLELYFSYGGVHDQLAKLRDLIDAW